MITKLIFDSSCEYATNLNQGNLIFSNLFILLLLLIDYSKKSFNKS
jgi:hypothetical protein